MQSFAVRGRGLFKLAKPVLVLVSATLALIPAQVAELLLVLTRHWPTKLGIASRYILVRRLSKECGDNVAVFAGVYCYHLQRARFGNHVSIHPMCYIDAAGGLTIGSHVSIAHSTTIMTTEHTFANAQISTKDSPVISAPVAIGNDVWIGAAVRILAGVTIGDHVVIGAGAVVTEDIPSHSLAIGVPARPIKTIKSR